MQSFGSRLRHERERRQIHLKSIAESTKISIPLLEALERGDVSRWPCGIFRKSFIRSYAEAIGLDPEPVMREFIELYPDPFANDVQPAKRARRDRDAASTPAPARSSKSPFAVKLTITWSGSVRPTIGRLADWRIVRKLQSFNPSMFQW